MSDQGQNTRLSLDALSVLMTTARRQAKAKRKRKRASSHFVLCPAGCGKSIGESLINVHLDQCIPQQEALASSQQQRQERRISTRDQNADQTSDKPDDTRTEQPTHPSRVMQDALDATPPQKTTLVVQDLENDPQSLVVSSLSQGDSGPVEEGLTADIVPPVCLSAGVPNAFLRMMKKSKVAFTSGKGFLHLARDGSVSLHNGTRPSLPGTNPTAWSAVVVLKDLASSFNGEETITQRRPLELTISTSLPNQESPGRRLVKNHSRIGPQVLKSILQKSVRRRKPLPAVRVAMELADKSLGDLLRRLPVIVLEDSMLHRDVPLLVWLMMAHSKGFCLPQALITRVMQIVYEVAACQWSDDPRLPESPSSNDSTDTEQRLCLNTLLASNPASSGSRAMLFSILVRADYGGMICDIQMLLQYACLWQARFRGTVPSEVASRLGFVDGELPWEEVPTRIHERARTQSIDRVSPLCISGIERLVFEDICVEGVDFHCSSIVDHLLSLPIAGICTDILILGQEEEVPSTTEARRSFIEGIFKHCMWQYSSGINRRQPLVAKKVSAEDGRPSYEELWKHLIAKEVLQFQTTFIQERLVRA